MKNKTVKANPQKTAKSDFVIPHHISLSFTCRFDMEEITRKLSVQQTTALFRGIAEILNAKNGG